MNILNCILYHSASYEYTELYTVLQCIIWIYWIVYCITVHHNYTVSQYIIWICWIVYCITVHHMNILNCILYHSISYEYTESHTVSQYIIWIYWIVYCITVHHIWLHMYVKALFFYSSFTISFYPLPQLVISVYYVTGDGYCHHPQCNLTSSSDRCLSLCSQEIRSYRVRFLLEILICFLVLNSAGTNLGIGCLQLITIEAVVNMSKCYANQSCWFCQIYFISPSRLILGNALKHTMTPYAPIFTSLA
jgi:hypothetical protein